MDSMHRESLQTRRLLAAHAQPHLFAPASAPQKLRGALRTFLWTLRAPSSPMRRDVPLPPAARDPPSSDLDDLDAGHDGLSPVGPIPRKVSRFVPTDDQRTATFPVASSTTRSSTLVSRSGKAATSSANPAANACRSCLDRQARSPRNPQREDGRTESSPPERTTERSTAGRSTRVRHVAAPNAPTWPAAPAWPSRTLHARARST